MRGIWGSRFVSAAFRFPREGLVCVRPIALHFGRMPRSGHPNHWQRRGKGCEFRAAANAKGVFAAIPGFFVEIELMQTFGRGLRRESRVSTQRCRARRSLRARLGPCRACETYRFRARSDPTDGFAVIADVALFAGRRIAESSVVGKGAAAGFTGAVGSTAGVDGTIESEPASTPPAADVNGAKRLSGSTGPPVNPPKTPGSIRSPSILTTGWSAISRLGPKPP